MLGDVPLPVRGKRSPTSPILASPPKRLRVAGKTFCARGVPLDWSEDDLQSFLEANELSDASVSSLANEIYGQYQTATILFENIPEELQTDHYLELPLPTTNGRRSLPITLDDKFSGITTLYIPEPQDHKVDVIAIHDIGGHAFESFKQNGGNHMWLRDALPYSIPSARIMIYGYNSEIVGSKSCQDLEDLASSLHSRLLSLARIPNMRPIIFIAHGMGGLIVKQVLINISRSERKWDANKIRFVYGFAFFGVPHRGMDITSLIPMVGDGPNKYLIESIDMRNSHVLDPIHRDFDHALIDKKTEMICFYETKPSPTAKKDENGEWKMNGPSTFLVSKFSATDCRPGKGGSKREYPIHRSHSDLVKFGPHDPEYGIVKRSVRNLVEQALAT